MQLCATAELSRLLLPARPVLLPAAAAQSTASITSSGNVTVCKTYALSCCCCWYSYFAVWIWTAAAAAKLSCRQHPP
jgi:hypothetical protein